MSAVAILVPVLARPHRVRPLLGSIAYATAEADYEVVFLTDPEDAAERKAVAASGKREICCGGTYAHKINVGFDETDAPLLFMAADDLRYHPGWFERASSYLRRGTDVVGTNDLCNPRVMTGKHSTHTLFRRSYIKKFSGVMDEPGKVLHEGYLHEYADDEFIVLAQRRGRYAHAFDALVEHLHPLVDKAPHDSTYELAERSTIHNRKLYRQRLRQMRNTVPEVAP